MMTVAKLIKDLLEATNQNAPVKFIDAEGNITVIENIYIGNECVVLEGENV